MLMYLVGKMRVGKDFDKDEIYKKKKRKMSSLTCMRYLILAIH